MTIIKKISFLLLIINIIYGCKTVSTPKPIEGVYQSEQKIDDYWSYLRFYKDYTVINVSSKGTPNEIKSWFNKRDTMAASGKYEIKGSNIFFDVSSKEGTVIYKGDMFDKRIEFNIRSKINGNISDQSYIRVE